MSSSPSPGPQGPPSTAGNGEEERPTNRSRRPSGQGQQSREDRPGSSSSGSSSAAADRCRRQRPSSGEMNVAEEPKFCTACSDCALLVRQADGLPLSGLPESEDKIYFGKDQMAVLYQYINVWVQRQCPCLFRDPKTVDRFCVLIQHLTRFCVQQLKNLETILKKGRRQHQKDEEQPAEGEGECDNEEVWSVEETERLLLFMAKIFMLQFPLYSGPKMVNHRFDEMSTAEATQLAVFCDVHDSTDFPIALLRNVTLFCRCGGLSSMAAAFKLPPSLLPPSIAHSLISILCNIKLWLNYRAVLQLFGPVRVNALHYMCGLSDAELRNHPARSMADFLWCSIKENVDTSSSSSSPAIFDRDGLELALKYFNSSTLTMRLAGIAQINSHIGLFNEMCNTESVVEAESVGLQLAGWILQNKLVEHIFGPNLHVEVIKQSHVLLNFLAVEGKITNDHLDAVWGAAQLKHCARQVQDLLLPLIKNLEAGPVLHLYDRVKELPVKEHTEQTIHLAQVLQKFIWTSGGHLSNILQEANALQQQHQQQQRERQQQQQCCPKTSKTESVCSSEDDQRPPRVKDTNSSNAKTLLERSDINAPECEFSLQDLEELDEFNEYSDDDDDEDEDEDDEEEEEEEEEEEDDEDDMPSSSDDDEHDERSSPLHDHRSMRRRGASMNLQRVPGSTSSPSPLKRKRSPVVIKKDKTASAPPAATAAAGTLPIVIPIRRRQAQEERSDSSPGKRTAGLLVKGAKRVRVSGCSSGGRSDEEEAVTASKKPLVTLPAAAAAVAAATALGSPTSSSEKKRRTSSGEGEVRKPEEKSSSSSCWWPAAAAAATSGTPTTTGATAMTELANLVNAQPRTAGPMRIPAPEIMDMRPVIQSLAAQQQQQEGENVDNESLSSRLSDKNLGDFEDENSVDEDMLQLAQTPDLGAMLQQQQQLACMASLCQQRLAAAPRLTSRQQREEARMIANYRLESACEPGNTLLWDLLQDENITQLADGLALEAEKALSSLLCYNMEKFIRMKFIEGCLTNLARNKSVAISLRLLPKLLQSFQHFRSTDTHEVTMYAERKHGMMRLFFTNLETYTRERREGRSPPPFFNHLAQIQIRLQFLSVVFSVHVSPPQLKLTHEQIRVLWESLADDPVCSDDLFQYLLMQVHTKEQHAINIEGFRIIYNEKLPTLRPETISMLGLNLFSQLCQLTRVTRSSIIAGTSNQETAAATVENSAKMEQLWKIALCAQNTDVSMKAIQILNSVYFGQGEEFLTTCLKSLRSAWQDLMASSARDETLIRIQRALLLLKTYLETFRRKYAYHFRRMSIDGHGVSTHAELADLRSSGPIRVLVQAAGFQDKVTLEMQAMDLVADLRAEVSAWWEGKLAHQRQQQQQRDGSGKAKSPLLGSMLNEGPLRLITQGQEVAAESDEKTMAEMGFKDLQLFLVSQGATRGSSSNNQIIRNSGGGLDIPAFPGRENMPMNLLLLPENFEQLFNLMQGLSDLRLTNEKGESVPQPKAQILSRRVWDILMLLPTNPHIKQALQDIGKLSEDELKRLLSAESPQKLMYTFYIVDWLGRPARLRRHSGPVEGLQQQHQQEKPWIESFISAGGLKHLFDIFVSGQLQNDRASVWCEWRQDCLSALLKLLVQFGVDAHDNEALADQLLEATATPRKRLKRYHHRHTSGGGGSNRLGDRLLVPRLSHTMLQLMDCDRVIPRLTSVLLDASPTRDPANHYRTGLFGRAQVVHFTMSLLVSWLYSAEDMEDALFASNGLPAWLKSLLLDDPDPAVRREMCTGLYKMCMGQSTTGGRTGLSCTAPLLSILLEFLDDALVMTPSPRKELLHHDEGKEPFGPACRDYFWILCRLVDNLHPPVGSSSGPQQTLVVDSAGLIDLDQLSRQLACGLVTRKIFERRHGDPSADDTLIGALNLLCAVMKHQPSFKSSPEGQEFLLHLLECLFALPTPRLKDLPKCKSAVSRTACYDLLVEMTKGSLGNYLILHGRLLDQHRAATHIPYAWEYWPRDDGRAECGYVGLTNLGATCYMASCVQQLYMIPAARESVLRSLPGEGKHAETLRELQRMFAYLRESERKAYNPLSFCKTYQMDHQPLNTGEQKDMAEFFIDLLSKMEEMSPDLKRVVKGLFGGTLTNNVVSLDCNHVSKTLEEFFTVRCQVSEMRNLYQSLEEVTVKDTLEGDNMYTCSQCGKKVRAEKRACFKRLPRVLAFNTMRYTFNMITMLKEKVNTHFSFPFRLDMSPYMEENLIPTGKQDMKKEDELENKEEKTWGYEYELIGVTVHTGTAEGGHYYAFIRDRAYSRDKWYSFNDAEVKPFDPNQIAAECFGGEMSSRTYDQVTDKYMDLSIEKTNSAYMLFYERIDPSEREEAGPSSRVGMAVSAKEEEIEDTKPPLFELSKELEEWIWQDNVNFIQDNNVFDHTYFNFMWQLVGFIPTTLGERSHKDITLLSAKLATSFFLESFIHAKEKLNIVQWVELLTKQFDSSNAACSWFLDHMASDTNWPTTIFLKCQVATIRQMFHRLCIHVIQKLRAMEKANYVLPWDCKDPDVQPPEDLRSKIGSTSPVTRFVRMLLSLLDSGVARPHLKYLTELFRFLYDFAKLGEEETRFLLSVKAIATVVEFYLKAIKQTSDSVGGDLVSDDDDDDDDDIVAIPLAETNRMASLDKMMWLIALLVEKSRGEDNMLHLGDADLHALVGGSNSSAASSSKSMQVNPSSSSSSSGLVFLYNVTKDNINTCQTCNLIFSLTRNNPELAEQVAAMVFHGVKQPECSVHFFRLLTLLTELSGGPVGMPCFTSLVMRRIWDLAKTCPQAALDWLSLQVTRNRYVQTLLLSTMDNWVEAHLLAHPGQKVRASAAFLVISLVPSQHFRATFRSSSSRSLPSAAAREAMLTRDETETLHRVLEFLFGLLPAARSYVDLAQHGSGKLVAYFQALTHCLLTRTEKRMLETHFLNLWQLFHPKLSEPSIPVNHNKHSLLNLWYTLCVDCPENVRLILQNPHVLKNIAFNYILADHEDTEVINFNRVMLPAYYGLLRMCCLQSRAFTRQLGQHQNIQWAFKNITPYTTQYTLACDELFKLMELFVQKYPEMTAEEEMEVKTFRHQTLQLYLSILDGRSSWSTLIHILKILISSDDDRIFVVYNNGLALIFEAVNMLHIMFHEATACHVTGELVELLQIFQDLLKAVRTQRNTAEITQVLSRWKDMPDMASRMLTLCNSYTPPEMRDVCLSTLKEMLYLWPQEMLNILVPMLHRSHSSASSFPGDSSTAAAAAAAAAASTTNSVSVPLGPYFPRKGGSNSGLQSLKAVRPPRPMLQMTVPVGQLEAAHGQDPEYDRELTRYFMQYHGVIDLMVRLAVNEDNLTKMLVDLSAMVGLDGVPLHTQLFPKLWLDIHNTEQIDRKFIMMLIQSHGFLEYVDAVLLDERSSLNHPHIFNFLLALFPRVADQVLTDQMLVIISELARNFQGLAATFDLSRAGPIRLLNGDLRALLLVNTAKPEHLTPALQAALHVLKERVQIANDALEEQDTEDNDGVAVVPDNTTTSQKTEEQTSPEEKSQETSSEDRTGPSGAGANRKQSSPTSSGKKRHSSSSHRIDSNCPTTREEKAKLSDAYSVCLKTLSLLIEMCENSFKIKAQASAAAAAAAAAGATSKSKQQEERESDDDEDDDSENDAEDNSKK